MFTMKNAALVGLAAADRTLFAPVAAPTYQQLAPAGSYALSADAYAQPLDFVQPVAMPAEPQGADSSFWLWTGAGALALVGAAAMRPAAASPVAALDEEDLECAARVAMLGVGGAGEGRSDGRGVWSKKEENQKRGALAWLMSGRKTFDGKYGELELLSGATRPASDSAKVLDGRFKALYDTRTRTVAKKSAPKAKTGPVTGFRSKNPMKNLYK